jgi:hypothetical protein
MRTLRKKRGVSRYENSTTLAFAIVTAAQHDRLNVERRLSDTNGSGQIRTSDIARLMELFQVNPSSIENVLSAFPF